MTRSAPRAGGDAGLTLDDLRHFAVERSLFDASSLQDAIDRFGFVQADPIRAPARAQDLILRLRVPAYQAGDLERHYPALDVEEDVFINYGFVSRRVAGLMHPRNLVSSWSRARRRKSDDLLAFVRERGDAHPRAVDTHFSHGRVTNYWGGSSSATTHLLEHMHYAGLLRVSRREQGVRIYGERAVSAALRDRAARIATIDALVDVLVGIYAPVPARSLGMLVSRLRYAVPQLSREIRPALARAKARLARAHVAGHEWYWPAEERPAHATSNAQVRLLAPFDPIVWDRPRFALLWGWEYRFEAYTPIAKRKLGYYALPMLWRDQVVGWANASVNDGQLLVDTGYVQGRRPRDRGFAGALELELQRFREFLGLATVGG
jgi:hypothetical protein